LSISKRLRFEILRRDNHACRYCGGAAPDVKLVVDHVVPVALGGADEPSNLVTACEPCNSGKSATPADAAVVDDVQADALRWAAAMRRAADVQLADLERRRELRNRFMLAWIDWTWFDSRENRRVTFDLPPDWETSVDNILAAGLPIELLCECVDIAMSAKRIKDEFRYMCGIAWRKVADMQEIAGTIVDSEADNGA